mmetsp:Transcript_10621/g.24164  ORF Transcript_10621/g.24164 Transcript_10621/m.24164 type:complete len:166 (-) Transcript_10621:117-614(-)|eukprot:CAMPEP_0114549176 /NCGR_PEP_ID=MMETSP0114-20121206/5387_1 /TAXON_ID=31324 /ORGANISM="Goniomonas sp, Strain m" /LENGTH=165 /DNA_ID=CAMNT_0001733839 /DNA_START=37 /DNA_END=534 /DNA_ORIENTATION=-
MVNSEAILETDCDPSYGTVSSHGAYREKTISQATKQNFYFVAGIAGLVLLATALLATYAQRGETSAIAPEGLHGSELYTEDEDDGSAFEPEESPEIHEALHEADPYVHSGASEGVEALRKYRAAQNLAQVELKLKQDPSLGNGDTLHLRQEEAADRAKLRSLDVR